jgi:hypothetical protein
LRRLRLPLRPAGTTTTPRRLPRGPGQRISVIPEVGCVNRPVGQTDGTGERER